MLNQKCLQYIGLGVLLALVVVIHFFMLDYGQASWIQAKLGYYFCFVLLGFVVYHTYHTVSVGVGLLKLRDLVQQHAVGLILCGVIACSFQLHDHNRFLVFNDEPSHQAIARSMHEFREVSASKNTYVFSGATVGAEQQVSYRMYFYSFLVSIVHDFTGYRMINGWLVNAFAGFTFCVLMYGIGSVILSGYGGFVALLLILSFPLIDASAIGYGYDLVNLNFIAVFFLVMLGYLKTPSLHSLNLLIGVGLILGYCRNESVLYLLPVALCFGLQVLKARSLPDLGFFATISPLFLIPIIASLEVFDRISRGMDHTYAFAQTDGFFAFQYVVGNLARIGLWMSDSTLAFESSPLITFLGVVALLFLCVTSISLLLKVRSLRISPLILSISFIAIPIIAAFVLILSHFWDPTSVVAVRFLLPLHFLFIIAGLWFLSEIKLSKRAQKCFMLGILVYVAVLAGPKRLTTGRDDYSAYSKHIRWGLSWMEKNDEGRSLYVSSFSVLFALHDFPAVHAESANAHCRDLFQLVREGFYDDLFAFRVESYDPVTQGWNAVSPQPQISELFVYEVVAEQRYAYNQRAQVLRLIGYKEDGAVVEAADLELFPRDGKLDYSAYYDAVLAIHPGF